MELLPHVGQGAELKRLLLESNGDFEQLELKVKRWTETKRSAEAVEKEVTKAQLKEAPYYWNEPRPQ